ncbi:MAG: vWA domain-containing protein [Hyphomicrobium sp.]
MWARQSGGQHESRPFDAFGLAGSAAGAAAASAVHSEAQRLSVAGGYRARSSVASCRYRNPRAGCAGDRGPARRHRRPAPQRADGRARRRGRPTSCCCSIVRAAWTIRSPAAAPGAGEDSKSAAARRLLQDFVTRRPHDRFGVAAFSTMPMYVLPITSHKDAVLGAVDAITRPGLAYTNVGLGLTLALSMHEMDVTPTSRAIVLVSDGAAVIDRRVQEKLRAQVAKRPINLYWLYIRTAGAKGIFDPPGDVPDTPQALPERHLNLFFQSLKIPYRAFEAENPEAVADAITEIDKLERNPIRYQERIPERDLSGVSYAIAAVGLLILLLAKLVEVRLDTGEGPATKRSGLQGRSVSNVGRGMREAA